MMEFGLQSPLKNTCKCPYCKTFMPFKLWSGYVGKKQCLICFKFFKLPLIKKEKNGKDQKVFQRF